MNDTGVIGQYGSHSCRSGDAGAVATTTSASAPEQAIVFSTLTSRTIGQVGRVDKTCPGMTLSPGDSVAAPQGRLARNYLK